MKLVKIVALTFIFLLLSSGIAEASILGKFWEPISNLWGSLFGSSCKCDYTFRECKNCDEYGTTGQSCSHTRDCTGEEEDPKYICNNQGECIKSTNGDLSKEECERTCEKEEDCPELGESCSVSNPCCGSLQCCDGTCKVQCDDNGSGDDDGEEEKKCSKYCCPSDKVCTNQVDGECSSGSCCYSRIYCKYDCEDEGYYCCASGECSDPANRGYTCPSGGKCCKTECSENDEETCYDKGFWDTEKGCKDSGGPYGEPCEEECKKEEIDGMECWWCTDRAPCSSWCTESQCDVFGCLECSFCHGAGCKMDREKTKEIGKKFSFVGKVCYCCIHYCEGCDTGNFENSKEKCASAANCAKSASAGHCYAGVKSASDWQECKTVCKDVSCPYGGGGGGDNDQCDGYCCSLGKCKQKIKGECGSGQVCCKYECEESGETECEKVCEGYNQIIEKSCGGLCSGEDKPQCINEKYYECQYDKEYQCYLWLKTEDECPEEGDEICHNEIDDDGDGLKDCLDEDCGQNDKCCKDNFGYCYSYGSDCANGCCRQDIGSKCYSNQGICRESCELGETDLDSGAHGFYDCCRFDCTDASNWGKETEEKPSDCKSLCGGDYSKGCIVIKRLKSDTPVCVVCPDGYTGPNEYGGSYYCCKEQGDNDGNEKDCSEIDKWEYKGHWSKKSCNEYCNGNYDSGCTIYSTKMDCNVCPEGTDGTPKYYKEKNWCCCCEDMSDCFGREAKREEYIICDDGELWHTTKYGGASGQDDARAFECEEYCKSKENFCSFREGVWKNWFWCLLKNERASCYDWGNPKETINQDCTSDNEDKEYEVVYFTPFSWATPGIRDHCKKECQNKAGYCLIGSTGYCYIKKNFAEDPGMVGESSQPPGQNNAEIIGEVNSCIIIIITNKEDRPLTEPIIQDCKKEINFETESEGVILIRVISLEPKIKLLKKYIYIKNIFLSSPGICFVNQECPLTVNGCESGTLIFSNEENNPLENMITENVNIDPFSYSITPTGTGKIKVKFACTNPEVITATATINVAE